MCTTAQVFVHSDKGCEIENRKKEDQFLGKTKKRMAVITAIRFLTMGYNQSISREALRAVQVPRVSVIRFSPAEQVSVISPLFVRPSGMQSFCPRPPCFKGNSIKQCVNLSQTHTIHTCSFRDRQCLSRQRIGVKARLLLFG